MKYDTKQALQKQTSHAVQTGQTLILVSLRVKRYKVITQADISQLILFGRLNDENGYKACVVETKDRQKCPTENSTEIFHLGD